MAARLPAGEAQGAYRRSLAEVFKRMGGPAGAVAACSERLLGAPAG